MERKIEKAIDGGSVVSITYDPYSAGTKRVKVAPKLTYLKTEGADNVGSVKKGSNLYVFNKSNEIEWLFLAIDTGEQMPEPGFGDGWFPLKPMDWTVLNSGDCQKFATSSDEVGVYLMFDTTSLK